ncbi:MFS transporter [Nguyenibacter vanlangensis]|uniref:MFS transporter n=1 Tax=Nguyenibacter vanlangensis TaxID=1216886 RepID=A0A7Y7M6A4_9PROT|nr:glycoside-pentoside-hexuronide (GPH):cation symporter [Nguyenibacter vanlangensis]NVN10283.1 MFS transporter [Nguyenibacter vanlangensis]
MNRPHVPERIGYGLGDLAGNGLFGITGSYLLYYYTNVYGIGASDIAILMLSARIFDSVVDPLIGYLIDHRRLFSGKIRPYLKWFAFPLGFATFLCFLPLPFGPLGRVAWAYVTYLLMGVFFSLVSVPYGLLPNVMTRDGSDRVVLATSRMVGATAGTFLVGSAVLPLVRLLGGGQERLGYPMAMAVIGVLCALAVLVPYRFCRERYDLAPDRRPVGTLLLSLLRNRAWIVVTAVLSLLYVSLTAFYGLSLYYAVEVLGRSQSFGGLLISVMGIAKVIGVLLSPPVARLFGQKLSIVLAYILSGSCLVLFYCSPNQPVLLILSFGLVCLFQGVTLPVFYAMLSDSIDFGAYVTGVRAAGMAYSVNSFMGKVAWAAGGSLSAAMLGWGRYVPHAIRQSAAARDCIAFGFVAVPLIVVVLSIGLTALYPSRDAVARAVSGRHGSCGGDDQS